VARPVEARERGTEEPRLLLPLLLIAALTVTVRLPFLLHADRFFDSDEAVEGLMARHVLQQHEYPVFLWGQLYKGVPEVYLASALFSVTGDGVVALKAVTLACFVLFVCLQFVLIETLFSRSIAWVSTAFVILGPPSLVLWSLSGNAEVVMTLVAGAVATLALENWKRSRSVLALAIAAAAIGFGLWVQQYIIYYVVALAIVAIQTLPDRRAQLRALIAADGLPPWLGVCTHILLAIAAAYITLGAVAFATGGFDINVGRIVIGLRSPQKLWRIGAAILPLYGLTQVVGRLAQPGRRVRRPAALAALAGFLVGYSPALLHARVSAPIARMDIYGLKAAGAPIVQQVLPIVIGLRSPTTEWLSVPRWFAVVIVAVVAVSYAALRARRLPPFFHVFLMVVPVLFIASGSFIDAQSYRYLMPMYAALPVVLAVGVDQIRQWHTAAAVSVLGVLLIVSAAEQVAWYQRLAPDARSPAVIACLSQQGARGALADYWLSYKVTFLAHERLIVAPYNGVDRYPPYTAFVKSLGVSLDNQPCRSLLLE